MVFNLGIGEMMLIGAAILFLILGPKKLPEFARSLGESRKEFKKSMQEAKEVKEEAEEMGEEMTPDQEDDNKSTEE